MYNGNKNLAARTQNHRFPLERFFEDFWGLNARNSWDQESELAQFTPKVEIEENDKEYLVHFEVPGIKAGEINIEVKDNLLTVSGERKKSEERNEKNFHYSERSYGSFQRSFTLPENVSQDKIEAKHDQGMLTVVVPKKEETPPKKITINSQH